MEGEMMKELGFEFDDDIFGESSCKESKVEEAYKPKQCDPEWYMQCSPSEDQFERQAIRKYQGDLLFQKQNYKEAYTMYQESRKCLPSNNAVMDRELIESMAMCLLKLGKCDDALTLIKEVMGDDQQKDSSIWHLLSQTYRAMGNIQGEIETLQRCTTLHSWNSHFWFSLALAYEKASVISCIHLQENCFQCKSCRLHQDLTEENCMENSLNGKWQSKEIDITIKCCCSSTNKVQGPIFTKLCDSDALEVTPCLAHSAAREQDGLVNMKCSCLPYSITSGHKTEFQEHSESICCLRMKCSEGLKDSNCSCLFSSYRKHLTEHCCGLCAKEKLKWRNHVIAFGCLVKSRFFLEKAIDASSSFAKDKSAALLREVNAKIAAHTDCGCAQLIDKVLQLLYTSVIASEQAMSEQEQSDTKTQERKQQENVATTFVSNARDFEQKWFGNLLSYMAGNLHQIL